MTLARRASQNIGVKVKKTNMAKSYCTRSYSCLRRDDDVCYQQLFQLKIFYQITVERVCFLRTFSLLSRLILSLLYFITILCFFFSYFSRDFHPHFLLYCFHYHIFLYQMLRFLDFYALLLFTDNIKKMTHLRIFENPRKISLFVGHTR